MLNDNKESIAVNKLEQKSNSFQDVKLIDQYSAIGIQCKITENNYECQQPKVSRTRKLHDLLLEIIDVLVSSCLIAPFVVAYWRGTWELMNIYLFPTNAIKSGLYSLAIGSVGHLFFQFAQNRFTNTFHPDKHRLVYYLISRFYTYIFGLVCVNMWRGWWVLCDYWLLNRNNILILSIAITMVPLFILSIARTVRTLPAAPFAIAMDHKDHYFEVNTFFRTTGFREPYLHISDVIFSIFIIGTLGVLSWRGVWGVLDLFLYPGTKSMSGFGSLIIGYGIVLLTTILQPLILFAGNRLHGFSKFLICDFYFLAQFVGSVSTWRGIWLLLEVYLKPDDPVVSASISHIISFLLLVLLNCSNSVLVKGIELDGNGTTIEYLQIPVHYVRLHFQHERYKKMMHSEHWEKNALMVNLKNANKHPTITTANPTNPATITNNI